MQIKLCLIPAPNKLTKILIHKKKTFILKEIEILHSHFSTKLDILTIKVVFKNLSEMS